MIIGFSGTRHGMSGEQLKHFAALVLELHKEDPVEAFHHGDCLGADAQAHDWIIQHLPTCKVYIHPSTGAWWRAYRHGHYIYMPTKPLERNRRIVDQCTYLIAAPNTRYEVMGSGTWSTVRYARKQMRTLKLLLP